MAMNTDQTLYHYIGGQRVNAEGGRFGAVYNPATGAVKTQVPLASSAEVRNAIANAQQAFPAWAATPPAQRAQVLFSLRDQIRQNMDTLAEALSSEHGKTLADAKGSITRGLEVVEFACGIPHLLKGEHSEAVARGVDSYSIRQPLGVCAGITPFNFPAMVPLWMIPVALACGNTFVLKPSEKDPSVPLLLAELASKAGLPDGVLNVVNGDKEAVDTLLTDPAVAAVSFVGSTAIGEYIYSTGCAHGKRVQALCGAKNHMVVMPDADLDQTIDAIIGSVYGSAGERCMAVSVVVAVFVHDPPHGSCGERRARRVDRRHVDDDSGEGWPIQGRLADHHAHQRVQQHRHRRAHGGHGRDQPAGAADHASREGADPVADDRVDQRGQPERGGQDHVERQAGGEAEDRPPVGTGEEAGKHRDQHHHVGTGAVEREPGEQADLQGQGAQDDDGGAPGAHSGISRSTTFTKRDARSADGSTRIVWSTAPPPASTLATRPMSWSPGIFERSMPDV